MRYHQIYKWPKICRDLKLCSLRYLKLFLDEDKKNRNLLEMLQHIYDTLVINHSYCKTDFNGHLINSKAITPNAKNVKINAIVINAWTTINQPGTSHSRIT